MSFVTKRACYGSARTSTKIAELAAGTAIPNLIKSKMAANQSGAAGTVRTINTGEATFSTVCAQVGYSMALADLNTGGGCTAGAGIIDTVLAGGTKSGYTFTEAGGAAVGGVNTTFTARAAPVTLGSSGQNMYCSDQLGVIRFDPSGKGCTNASLPIGN